MGIRESVANVARIEEVVTVFMHAGFQVPLARMKLTHCSHWRCRMRCTINRWTGRSRPEKEWGAAVRESLIKLGPAFVKLGQIMSVRSDLIPASLADELRKLQSTVPPFPYEVVRSRIEEEIGEPLEKMFRSFSEEPLAAASIGQVHEAELLDGTRVAVKIKRPGIDAVVRRDMEVLVWLASHAEQHSASVARYRPVASAKELRDYTLRELDFRHEARIAKRLSEFYGDRPGVRVPTVYESTTGLLVMEFIDGVPLDDLESLHEKGVDLQKLVRVALEAVLAQIFEFGLFHGDPHPGNLHVTENGDLIFLDFGIFGEFDEATQRLTALLMDAMVHSDIDRATSYLVRMARLRPDADPEAFREEIGACYKRWQGSTVSEYGFAKLVYDELSLGAKHGLIFPTEMVLFGKAMLTIEGVLLALAPDLDVAKESAPYMTQVGKNLFSTDRLYDALERSRPVWWELAEALPLSLPRAVDRLLRDPVRPPVPPRPRRAPFAQIATLGSGLALLLAQTGPTWRGLSVLGMVVFLAGITWMITSGRGRDEG